ncbi:MAG: Verru_Chthon cassette protein A, partial [Verrucomicrobiota bacterium]|nr:Verru_Chthon cassette protein A [Verrucomicrobiota bacterium]
MKTSQSSPPLRTGRRGVALVIVLGFLVVISAVALAFFSSAQTELIAAKTYASGASTRQLADSAVQIVMGLISEATSRGENVAWASQPGMIKTYGSSSLDASPDPLAFYKLYSASPQVLTRAEISDWDPFKNGGLDTDIPSNWDKLPGMFTDLNAPVTDRFDETNYPILDPRAGAEDADAGTKPVQGFKKDQAPGGSDNEVPMPVRWIYVLEDGSLASPVKSTDGKTVEFQPSDTPADKLPSKTNRIAGRIAFWTDDDSCKLNINTAAGDEWREGASETDYPGSYWDTPRVGSVWEKTYLALNQPHQKEYQRYPGHPATTYLSAVFPSWKREEIMRILPRVVDGGSEGGLRPVPEDQSLRTGALEPDADRLYASVDELMFRHESDPAGGLQRRETNNAGLSDRGSLDRAALERVRFFLTAHSRAPDVNLFNRPRVSIWPVHREGGRKKRTPHDALIAHCGGIGPRDNKGDRRRYFFLRDNARSQIEDLDNSPATKENNDAGALNRRVLNYLRGMTGRKVPGFRGSFVDKYTAKERDQILVEIFDYIRSTNVHDTSTDLIESFAAKRGVAGHGEVIPIIHTGWANVRGFGRFPTICEVAILFYVKQRVPDPENKVTKLTVQAVLMVEPYNVAHGFVMYHPNYVYTADGLDRFEIAEAKRADGTPNANLGFPAEAHLKVDNFSGGPWHQRGWGGPMSVTPLIAYKALGTGAGNYTFCSKDFLLEVPEDDADAENAKMKMQAPGGGPITFKITARLPDNQGAETIQA